MIKWKLDIEYCTYQNKWKWFFELAERNTTDEINIWGGTDMIDGRIWNIMQKRLGYSDEEQELFRNNPRNEQVLSNGSELSRTLFIVEVIDAHGCNSRNKKGDKIYLDGYGNLLKEKNPEKLCIFMIGPTNHLFLPLKN
jgi:hypothetical protein